MIKKLLAGCSQNSGSLVHTGPRQLISVGLLHKKILNICCLTVHFNKGMKSRIFFSFVLFNIFFLKCIALVIKYSVCTYFAGLNNKPTDPNPESLYIKNIAGFNFMNVKRLNKIGWWSCNLYPKFSITILVRPRCCDLF